MRTQKVFGYVSVSTAYLDVSDVTTAIPDLAAEAELSVKSSDVNDASAGTGLRTLTLEYLNATFDPKRVTFTMNGTTLVAAGVLDILQPLRIVGATFGSGNKNAGDVTLENTGGGTVYEKMLAGENVSRSARWMVPAGTVGRVRNLAVHGANGTTSFELELVTDFDPVARVNRPGIYYPTGVILNRVESFDADPLGGELLPAGTVIKARAKGSGAGTLVAASFLLDLSDLG